MPSAPIKVLFVSREKQNGNISPVVMAQADSLKGFIDLTVCGISGSGWKAYLKGIAGLKKFLKANEIDLVHTHYSYVGMVAALATRKPIVVSLMGSDIEDFWFGRVLIRFFAKVRWGNVIVKSERSMERIKLKHALVIPNGVDMDIFQASPKEEARKKLGLKKEKKYVLFLSHPGRKEKNYKLADESCRLMAGSRGLGAGGWEMMTLYDKPHSVIPLYFSAADVLLLTSFFEGSPNAVKEAMACSCPVVSTDVGDVKEVIGDTEGCYITSFDPKDVAAKIKLALDFGKRTNGREKILHLDSKVIVRKLVEVYESVLK